MAAKVAPAPPRNPEKRFHTISRPAPSLREAIHGTVARFGNLKELSLALDMGLSDLSQRSTLGDGDHVRSFPAERLAKLMQATGDVSVLLTLADLVGYEVRPRKEVAAEAAQKLQEMLPEIKRFLRAAEEGGLL